MTREHVLAAYEAADTAVTNALAPLLSEHDPRTIIRSLLGLSAQLSTSALDAGALHVSDVTREFNNAAQRAIEGHEAAIKRFAEEMANKPRIQVVGADALRKG